MTTFGYRRLVASEGPAALESTLHFSKGCWSSSTESTKSAQRTSQRRLGQGGLYWNRRLSFQNFDFLLFCLTDSSSKASRNRKRDSGKRQSMY